MFKKGMDLQCVEPFKDLLTKGKIYKCRDVSQFHVSVVADDGIKFLFQKQRFKAVGNEVFRVIQLNANGNGSLHGPKFTNYDEAKAWVQERINSCHSFEIVKVVGETKINVEWKKYES